jgi:type I restriction enzyme S subunit
VSKGIKPGWRKVKFGDVVQLSKARCADPLAEGIEHFVGLEHLEPGDLRIRSWGNVADGVTFTSLFKPGQVLFGKRRAYQRKVAMADFSGVCSGDIYVLESKDAAVMLPELLPFICQTDAFFEHAVGTSAGSLSPRTNWTSLAGFEFSLPPMEEQQRFVEVITATDESLDTLQELRASTYAALSSMMEHVSNTCAAGEPSQLQQFADLEKNSFVNGPFGSDLLTSELTSSGVPVIYVRDIKPNRYLRVSPSHVTEEKADQLRFCNVLPGDVLVAKVGDPPGWAAPYFSDNRSVVTQDVIRIRPGADVDPVFLAALLNSSVGVRGIQSIKISGTRERFPLTQFKKLLLPKPPLSVQKEIARAVSDFMAAFDLAEKRIDGTRKLRARLLTQLFQC